MHCSNDFLTHQVDGSIEDYHADNAYEEFGFDFGEKALDTAFIPKGSSRRANYSMLNRVK